MTFTKTLRPTDTDENQSNSNGISIPKPVIRDGVFGDFRESDENPRNTFKAYHSSDREWMIEACWYNNKFRGGTRNEYRLIGETTQMIKSLGLQSGDKITFELREPGRFEVTVDLPDVEPDPPGEELRGLPEGAKKRITVNRYERSQSNRNRCLELRGKRCVCCDKTMGEIYGDESLNSRIHVHHKVPVADLGGLDDYQLDIEKDLVPVCPNCHAVIHSGPEGLRDPEEVREMLNHPSS